MRPLLLLLLLVSARGAAAGDPCYPAGGVAGIVVATVVATCAAVGLGAALLRRYWWTPRAAAASVRQEPKQAGDFAFDNPYFRNSDAAKSKFSLNKNSLRSSKVSDGSIPRPGRRGVKNPFGASAAKKQKAMDDSCLNSVDPPDRRVVRLRGKDFTGLGFNICGNMRDGILVKDVLHRGPASESGLIRAGDKISSITVSFTNIVFEDALTILSYASPYDVQLQLEPPSSSRKQQLGSCSSFSGGGQKLFHPLYRSQSIDDLTQIDTTGPRRSQSVGVAAHKLVSSNFFKESSSVETPTPSKVSATGSLNEKMLASQGLKWKKQYEDDLGSDESNDAKTTRTDGSSRPPRPGSSRFVRSDAKGGRNPGRGGSAEDPDGGVRNDSFVGDKDATPRALKGLGEEENDSDVSRDSLEHVGRRARRKQPAPGAPEAAAASLAAPRQDLRLRAVEIPSPESSCPGRGSGGDRTAPLAAGIRSLDPGAARTLLPDPGTRLTLPPDVGSEHQKKYSANGAPAPELPPEQGLHSEGSWKAAPQRARVGRGSRTEPPPADRSKSTAADDSYSYGRPRFGNGAALQADPVPAGQQKPKRDSAVGMFTQISPFHMKQKARFDPLADRHRQQR